MSLPTSSPSLLHDLDEVVGRVEHSPVSQTPALKVARPSDSTGARLQHPCEGSIHVVAPEAHLHGIARTGHVELVHLPRRGCGGDTECQADRAHLDVLGRTFGGVRYVSVKPMA